MSYANHPNAALIDEVLTHFRAHPHRWADARRDALVDGRTAAWCAARDARYIAYDATRYVALDVALHATLGTARDAVAALVAYPEEAAALLRQDPDVVRMVASTGNHAAVLLLPATLAMASNP